MTDQSLVEETLEDYRTLINQIFREMSSIFLLETVEEEVDFHMKMLKRAESLELKLNQFITMSVDNSNETGLCLILLHGVLLLGIWYLKNEVDDSNKYMSLEKIIDIIYPWKQYRQCVWLYSQAKLLHGNFYEDDLGDFENALQIYLDAIKNIEEYHEEVMSDDELEPTEIQEILENPDHEILDVIFDNFNSIYMTLQVNVVTCAIKCQNEHVMSKYGVDAIRAAYQMKYHRDKENVDQFMRIIESICNHFIKTEHFKQAQHLISFYKYIIKALEESRLSEEIISFEVSHAELIATYTKYFLSAVEIYRKTTKKIPAPMKHKLVVDEDVIKNWDAELPYMLNLDDKSVDKLMGIAHGVSLYLKSDEIPNDDRKKDTETQNLNHLRTQIASVKSQIRRLSENQAAIHNTNQKFYYLSSIEDEARTVLKTIEQNHVLYEEIASVTCAIGLLIVKDFYLDERYHNKTQQILDQCECLAESLRLLPSGLVLYMSTQYFQARIIVGSEKVAKEHLNAALKMLNDAKMAYDEFYCVNSDLYPEHLYGILETPCAVDDTITDPKLRHMINHLILETAIKLQDFLIIQDVFESGVNSIIRLYRSNSLGLSPLIEILITLSYEFLEYGHLSQANHLIANVVIILRDHVKPPPKLTKSLNIFRLCYYHTLICKSLQLLNESTEHKAKKHKGHVIYHCLTETLDILQEESSYPNELTTNINEINGFFKKANDLIKILSPPPTPKTSLSFKKTQIPMNATLVNEIKEHLDKKHVELNGTVNNNNNV